MDPSTWDPDWISCADGVTNELLRDFILAIEAFDIGEMKSIVTSAGGPSGFVKSVDFPNCDHQPQWAASAPETKYFRSYGGSEWVAFGLMPMARALRRGKAFRVIGDMIKVIASIQDHSYDADGVYPVKFAQKGDIQSEATRRYFNKCLAQHCITPDHKPSDFELDYLPVINTMKIGLAARRMQLTKRLDEFPDRVGKKLKLEVEHEWWKPDGPGTRVLTIATDVAQLRAERDETMRQLAELREEMWNLKASISHT
jgi:hypothetical protein